MTKPRTPMDALLDRVDWREIRECEEPVVGEIPYATHEGVLRIPGLDVELDVVQLNTGQRIITEESLVKFLEWMGIMEGEGP